MYYHMDMHGGAYSYQWIGSTYLPRVWEQMSQAYEFGVREIWVANIGDIGTQEYGLSFFLDLAYDIDKWGGRDCGVTKEYSRLWVDRHFAPAFSPKDRDRIDRLIWGYTDLLERRKHEIMNAEVYHPVHYNEAENVLKESEFLLKEAQDLKTRCDEKYMSSFVSLIYYPVCGTANLMKMWILAGRNKLFAEQNRIEANPLAVAVDECMKRDKQLIDEYETIDSGYYKGFGKSLHIGFINWNDEDCKYPVRHIIYPAEEPRMLVTRPDSINYSTGLVWCDRSLVWNDFARPDIDAIDFCVANGSEIPYWFMIESTHNCLSFTRQSGQVRDRVDIRVFIDKTRTDKDDNFSFSVKAYKDENMSEQFADSTVNLVVKTETDGDFSRGTFVEHDGYISFHAKDYVAKRDTEGGAFAVLEPYGKCDSAVKVFPVVADFLYDDRPPYVEYSFAASRTGEYSARFYLAPTTPVCFERIQFMGFSVNDEPIVRLNTVENTEIPFFLSEQWEREAKNNIKLVECKISCKQGENRLRFYGMSPGIVLEKVLIWNPKKELKESYLGPTDSFRVN